jgi:adenylosuccinate synthase
VIDYLAGRFDAVARFNGGSNAGHTVVIGGVRHTFHLIPSGALKEKELLVGAGVAVDPVILAEELSQLPPEARKRLTVDGRCSLVSPLDKELDSSIEEMRAGSPIGTTRRGIGPSYAARALRLSPTVSDLLAGFDFAPLSKFYRKFALDPTGLSGWADDSRRLLGGMVGDVSARIGGVVARGGSVLFEGSQGTLLDLLHGSYPFVTSTHTTASYIPASLGIPPSMSGEALGVTKCYATRVGGGPFPTEVTGPLAEGLRSIGKEFGATTGRPRRVGWLDIVALRYAIGLNGAKEVAVSKLDVLAQVKESKACIAYAYQGSESEDFQGALPHLGEVKPVYEEAPPLQGADFAGGLPPQGKKFVQYLEERLNVKVTLVSHGEERSKTIEL